MTICGFFTFKFSYFNGKALNIISSNSTLSTHQALEEHAAHLKKKKKKNVKTTVKKNSQAISK